MTVVRFPAQPITDPTPRLKVLHTYRRHAPKKAPCPHCGQRGHRKDFHERTDRSIAYQAILLVHVTTAEYRASCACCVTFRTQIDGIEPKAHYDNKVLTAVLDRLLDDRMSMAQIQQAMQRDFLLDLSDGFLYDCLDWKIRQLDGSAYRQWTLAQFSGTLRIDEIHLGEHTLLLATDPLADFPVAFALVSANDQDHMGRFLRQLAGHGFAPQVVQALAMLPAEKFTMMIAFLRSPVGSRVRTNNHVERLNRVLRFYEKSRYKWRLARTKVRFVWLLVKRRWGPQVRQGACGGGRQGGAIAEPCPTTAADVGLPPPCTQVAA